MSDLIEQVRDLLNRWEAEEDVATRTDYVLDLQDLADKHGGQVAREIADAGVPGVLA